MEALIILLLVGILYLKWIIFLLMIPVIRLVHVKKKRKLKDISSEIIDSVSEDSNRRGFISIIKLYLAGYIRYANFQVGLIPSHYIRNFLYRNVFIYV